MNSFIRSTALILLGGMLTLSGCYTVPETGRRAFIATPLSQEVALGASAFQEIKQQERVSTDPEAIARVSEVGRRIAAVAADDMPDLEWEFVVFDDDDTINAFALPGGKVGVYTGLLDIAETDDHLAAVIGHEIAHVTARHGGERMTRAISLAAAGIGLGIATRDSEHQNAIMIAYGLGSTLAVELPFSRRAEKEADEVGIMYAARAGFDPRKAVDFWQRMHAVAEGRPQVPTLLSTHPSDQQRIAHLKSLMPEAMEEFRRATAGADQPSQP